MAHSYHGVLTDAGRAELNVLLHGGVAPARMLTPARILLKAGHGKSYPAWADAALVGTIDVNVSTVLRVRPQFATDELTATCGCKRPDRVSERKLHGEQAAKRIALARSEVPDGPTTGPCGG